MNRKLIDHLFTARWAVNNNASDLADKELTEALEHLGAVKAKAGEEPDRPSKPMPEDFGDNFEEPQFKVVRGVKYVDRGQYRTPSGMFKGLVVHYTVSGRSPKAAQNVVRYLAGERLGCLVMDENGVIYHPENFDPLRSWGYHAGKSGWFGAQGGLSDEFCGMEICCWGKDSKVGPFRTSQAKDNIIPGTYQAFTEAQEVSLINFIRWAKAVNPEFSIENVVGHDEAREYVGLRGQKQDPGASLSMTMPEFRDIFRDIRDFKDF